MHSPIVLLFNASANVSRAARLHAPQCPMANGSGLRLIRVEGAELEPTIADVNRRGFLVRECTCLEKARATVASSD